MSRGVSFLILGERSLTKIATWGYPHAQGAPLKVGLVRENLTSAWLMVRLPLVPGCRKGLDHMVGGTL